jgi:hypothetical protein
MLMSVMDVVPIVELVVKVAAALRERRETYLENTEINDAIEQRREALLRRLTISHNRILFEISDSDLVIRLVPFAMEQTLSLYSASKEADFSLIELSISQIESALITNEASRRSRQSRRTLAVWFAAIVIVILIGIVAASPYLGLSTDTIIPVIRAFLD